MMNLKVCINVHVFRKKVEKNLGIFLKEDSEKDSWEINEISKRKIVAESQRHFSFS